MPKLQLNYANLVDHVAGRMPLNRRSILVGLHKVLEHFSIASSTFRCKHDRVVVVAINVSILFKVRIVLAKYFRLILIWCTQTEQEKCSM
jgi:hypothetical protein